MKRFIYSSVISTIMFLNFGYTKSWAQVMKEVRLNNINAANDRVIEDAIIVFFKTDIVQQKSAGGLTFSIKLVNRSNKDVFVHNPLNYLQILLIDSNGNNVNIPQPPNALINTQGKRSKYKSFAVKKVVINNKNIITDTLIKDIIAIPASGVCEFVLQVEDVLATRDGKKVSNTDWVKIRSGNYKLGVTLSLIGEGVSSQILQLSPITINYN